MNKLKYKRKEEIMDCNTPINTSPNKDHNKDKSRKRKATPYHINTKDTKLSVETSKRQVLFKDNLNSVDRNGNTKHDLLKSPTQISKIFCNSGKLSKTSEKILNRESTPYHILETIKKHRKKPHRLFSPSTTSQIISPKSTSEFFVSDSAPSLNMDFTSTRYQDFLKSCKKSERNRKRNKTVEVDVEEVVCDNKDSKDLTCHSIFQFSSEEENSRNSVSSEEYSTRFINLSDSIIDGNLKSTILAKNKPVQSSSKINPFIIDDSFSDEDNNDSVKYKTLEQNDGVQFVYLKDSIVIVLHNNKQLYFHGLLSITVLHGVVEVFGYKIKSTHKSYDLFSPKGYPLLYLESKKEYNSFLYNEKLGKTFTELGIKNIEEFCKKIKPDSSVILCKKIHSCEMDFITRHFSRQLFPTTENSYCNFNINSDQNNLLKLNFKWNSIIDMITVSSKMILCGGKGVGKTTLLKYMINKLLQKHKEILVIDLDPGQSELTIGGCISAHIINSPIFGPNFTHLREPNSCLLVPNIDVSQEPDKYLESVEELMKLCSTLPKIPTLINYMGFTRGFGIEVFSAVIAYVQPTHLLQIQSNQMQLNFEKVLTYNYIKKTAKTLAPRINVIPNFAIMTVSSVVNANPVSSLDSRRKRDLSILAYLSTIFSKGYTGSVSYITDISTVKIICNGKIVSPAVVNRNLVALCSSLPHSKSYKCFGWGVVRGIDFKTNELFLSTPVSPDDLEKVECIIQSPVSLSGLNLTSDCVGLIPYAAEGISRLGTVSKRTHLAPKNRI